MQIRPVLFATLSVSLVLMTSGAFADVSISSDATQNMSCTAGVCAPTASDAVLNVGDLETMLAAGNVSITTSGSGVQANNIDVIAKFDWTANSGLTLDAYQSITFTASATDAGPGSVSLVTNDGGSGGQLSFLGKQSFTIANLADSLSINGVRYKLVNSLNTLAYAIAKHPGGAFALANNFDASKHHLYRTVPIPVNFTGSLNGLGHSISHLVIADSIDSYVGLFYELSGGTISSIGLNKATIRAVQQQNTGGLVGFQVGGMIFNSWVSGTVDGGYGGATGGLVGYVVSNGLVTDSWSSAKVHQLQAGGVGGLVGSIESSAISDSFATGHVDNYACVGGLVGYILPGAALVTNSYARGSESSDQTYAQTGGFAGCSSSSGTVKSSYSTGLVAKAVGEYVGGFLGGNSGTKFSSCYWDKGTSGTDTGVGSGPVKGVKGLSSRQFKSGLPKGFDPSIWAEDPAINGGFPYLIHNPPVE